LTDFDDALVNHLLSQSGLAALVANRIYPDYFPQSGQLPAVAYTLEDDSSSHMMQGVSRLRRAIYQINVWAETCREAMTVARQICRALDGFRGAFLDIPGPGAFLDSLGRERDPDTGAYCASMRFTIHYQQKET
jgi:hypothetical protein